MQQHPSPQVDFEYGDHSKLTVRIYTERLILESLDLSCTSLYYDNLYSKAKIMEKYRDGSTWDYNEVDDVVKIWTDRWEHGIPFSNFKVVDKIDKQFIGTVTLGYGQEKGTAELAYILNDQYWGKKFGTEIVDAIVNTYAPQLAAKSYKIKDTDFTAIVATARTDNDASWKILNNVGMHIDKEYVEYGAPRYHYVKYIEPDASHAVWHYSETIDTIPELIEHYIW